MRVDASTKNPPPWRRIFFSLPVFVLTRGDVLDEEVLGLDEEGDDVVGGPAGVAQGGPVVVVLPVATCVDGAVERRTSAEHSASVPAATLQRAED